MGGLCPGFDIPRVGEGSLTLYQDSIAAFRRGDTDAAMALANQLVQQGRRESDLAAEIDGLCMLARVELRRRQYRRTRELADSAREMAMRSGSVRLERMPIHLQAAAARMLNHHEEARRLYRESIDLNGSLGEPFMVAAEHRNLAYVELAAGAPDRARALFAEAAALARDSGYSALEPLLLLDQAVWALEDGDREKSARLLAEMRAEIERAGQILDPDDAEEEARLRARLADITP